MFTEDFYNLSVIVKNCKSKRGVIKLVKQLSLTGKLNKIQSFDLELLAIKIFSIKKTY